MPNSINPSPFNETRQPQGYFSLNREHPLSKGLVATYPFSDGDASKLYDYSGYGHHATFQGSTLNHITTEKGWVFDFDGSNDYFSAASTEKLKITEEITISAWINVDQFKDQIILTKGGTSTAASGNVNYGFRLGSVSGGSSDFKKLNFYINDNFIGGVVEFMSSSDIITSTSTWYHVAIKFNFGNTIEDPILGPVFDDTTSSAKMFVNGNFVPGSWSDIGFGMPAVSDEDLWIGRKDSDISGSGESGSNYFDGKIQNILIYDRYLSDVEINQLFTKPWAVYKSPITVNSFTIPDPQTYTDAPTGGIIASGDVSIDFGDIVEISGGIIANGTKELSPRFNPVLTGGAKASGEATYQGSGSTPLLSGILLASGEAIVQVTYNQSSSTPTYSYDEIPAGGLQASGEATVFGIALGDAGLKASGIAAISLTYSQQDQRCKYFYGEMPLGGIIASGSSAGVLAFWGDGNALLGGEADISKIEEIVLGGQKYSYIETPVGGIQANGSISIEDAFQIVRLFPFNGIATPLVGGTALLNGSATISGKNRYFEEGSSGVVVGDATMVAEEIGSGGTTTSGISTHSASDCGGIILSAQTEYIENVIGGTTLSGTGSELKEFNHITIGGLTTNGAASESASVDRFAYTEVPVGGSQLNGNSTVAYGTWGNGQGEIGGSATEYVYYNNLTSETGGVQAGGQTLQFDEIATGGIKGQGATILSEVITLATEGGIQINGAAIDSCSDIGGLIILGELTLDETGSGGALVSGLVSSIDLFGSGGAVINGQVLDSASAIGGLISNGSATISEIESTHEAAGGVHANGAVIEFKVSEETVTGGLVASGSSSQFIEFGTFGEALLNGEATIAVIYLVSPSGGISANGAADENFGDIVEVVVGGLTASGVANSVKIHIHYPDSQTFAYDEYHDGGLQTSGEADVFGIALGDAGVLVSGEASMEVLAIRNGIHQPYERFEEIPSGGVILSDGVYQNVTGDGGVSINGNAIDSASDNGGVILNLTAIIMFQYDTQGGTLAEGSATINVIRFPAVSGGIVGSGTIGIYEIDSSFTVTGGIVLNSAAELTAPYNIIVSGGITASGVGDPDFIDIFDTSGGIVAGGEIGAGAPDGLYGITTFTPSGGIVCAARLIFTDDSILQGGVEVSGSANAHFVLWPEPTGGIKAGTAGLIESPVWKYTPDGKSTNSSVIDEKSSTESGTTTSSSFDQLSALPLISGTLNGTIYRLDQAIQTFTVNESGVFAFVDIGEPSPKVSSGTVNVTTGIITLTWDGVVPGENYLILSYEFEGPRLAGVQINGASKLTRGHHAFTSSALILDFGGSALLRISYNDRICDPEETLPCTISSPTQYRECIVSNYYASNPALGQRFSSRAKLPAITLCRQAFYVPTENITIPPA